MTTASPSSSLLPPDSRRRSSRSPSRPLHIDEQPFPRVIDTEVIGKPPGSKPTTAGRFDQPISKSGQPKLTSATSNNSKTAPSAQGGAPAPPVSTIPSAVSPGITQRPASPRPPVTKADATTASWSTLSVPATTYGILRFYRINAAKTLTQDYLPRDGNEEGDHGEDVGEEEQDSGEEDEDAESGEDESHPVSRRRNRGHRHRCND